jgi:hypothetical protein
MLDLNALVAQVRVETRIKTKEQSLNARLAQRATAEQLADAAAREQAKRESLARALSSESLDAMRFRWLAEHSGQLGQLAGLNLVELRTEVDSLISKQAARRLSEMRGHYTQLTGKVLPEMEFDRA